MNVYSTQSIVLSRTNYGEADKIVTLLTSDGMKLSAIVKGVRKSKSKLVASSELFCTADICYALGKGSMATITSARLIAQYTNFLHDLDKVGLAYDMVKTVNRHTESDAGVEYYALLEQVFIAINSDINAHVVSMWAWLRLLHTTGHGLQLQQQTNGEPFNESLKYGFDIENGGFVASVNGNFGPQHIKLLRIAQAYTPQTLTRVHSAPEYAAQLAPYIKQFVESTH